MKKIIKVSLCILVLFTICACKKETAEKEDNNETIGSSTVNPIVECKDLDEVNAKVGTNLTAVGVMGREDKSFSYINVEPVIGQYVFEINGIEYTLRASKNTKEDISGLYIDGNTFEEGKNLTLITKEYKMDRFFVDGIQYVLMVKDNGQMSDEAFYNAVDEIETIHGRDNLVGEYADRTSQRATAIVTKEDDQYVITVHWSSSAQVATEWTMYATFDGEKLNYAGENISIIKSDDKGNTTVEETASNNIGYFEVKDNVLYWTGAGDQSCRECAFEKMK